MTESLRERSSSAKAGSSGWMDETFSVQRLLKTKPHTLSNSSSSARMSSTSSSPPFLIANTAIFAASSIFASSIFQTFSHPGRRNLVAHELMCSKYSICFTKLEWAHESEDRVRVPGLPIRDCARGFACTGPQFLSAHDSPSNLAKSPYPRVHW